MKLSTSLGCGMNPRVETSGVVRLTNFSFDSFIASASALTLMFIPIPSQLTLVCYGHG